MPPRGRCKECVRPTALPAPARVVRRAALVAVALASFGTIGPRAALAGDGRLVEWVDRYKATLGRHDDVAYTAEREALDAIADLDTPEARRTLRSLAVSEREGTGGDARRMALILSAITRRGDGPAFDFVVDAVETWRGASLFSALPRILGSATAPSARAIVRDVILRRGTVAIRAAAARALGAIGDRAAVLPLLEVLRDDDLLLRAEAISALGELKDESAVPALAVFLRGADPRLREACARALGVLGSAQALPSLVRALGDAVPRVVESAAGALALLAPQGVAVSIPAIIDRWFQIHEKDDRVEDAFERALVRMTGADVGADPELWKSWWAANKDRPPAEVRRKEAPTTVAGARYYGFGVRSDHVVFVLDVSRSMGWNDRLESARKELIQAIQHLRPRTRFSIVSFSDSAWPWSDELIAASPEAVKKAVRFVERLEPLSGTNSFEALRTAFKNDEVDSIYFLSDGHPSSGSIVDPDAILQQVRELNRWRRVRIHAIALLRGDPPPEFAALENPAEAERFMRRLAEENDGGFIEVR